MQTAATRSAPSAQLASSLAMQGRPVFDLRCAQVRSSKLTRSVWRSLTPSLVRIVQRVRSVAQARSMPEAAVRLAQRTGSVQVTCCSLGGLRSMMTVLTC